MTDSNTPLAPDSSGSQGDIGRALVADMERITWDRIGEEALENARRNLKYSARGQSLAALRGQAIKNSDSAVVIAAGPSIKRKDPLRLLKQQHYDGAIVTTESAIFYCLSNNVVPDLVVTLDPHATRIVRWFGDPNLTAQKLAEDDYYRRQDMDEAFAKEVKLNGEVLALLDEHGHKMRIALSTSASDAVVDRVLSVGMQIYWWNPMLDNPDAQDSCTVELHRMNGFPCVNAGGNVGAAAWMMSHAVLGKKHVAITGMDFSYYDGTPYKNTQYYHDAVALVGEDNLDRFFMRVYNPHLEQWSYTDPAYMWYREAFLEMVQDANCITYNCTEGGILFGDNIEFISLQDYLDLMAKTVT